MWFGVLGPIEVRHGDHEVPIGRRKERAVLAVLLAAANHTVPLDRIIDLLWGDEAPNQATSSLHAYISNLRRRLEPERPPRSPATRLVTRPPGYALVAEPSELDSALFETLVSEASRAVTAKELHEAERLMTEGLELWRGPAYGEFGDEPFAISEVIRLGELRAATIEDRLEVRLALGRTGSVIAEAEAVVSATPTRERAWAHLMTGLYRAGRQTEALQAYQRCRTILADLSGVDPGPELQRLEGCILAQDPELLGAGPQVSVPSPPRTVRALIEPSLDPGTGLVGRRQELLLLDRLIESAADGLGQLVVLSGEAGVGKTALVAEMAVHSSRVGFQTAITRWPETLDRPALAPWLAVLEQLEQVDAEVTEAVRGAIIDARTPTVGGLIDAVVDAVVEQASACPLLLVCDDVQWAEELSHDLIRRLAERAANCQLVLVLVRRHPATDEQPGLVATLATLARLPVTRLDLEGLSPDEMILMIENATQITPSTRVAAAIHEQTAGNAFYALELGRLLGAEGDLTADDDLVTLGVPVTVRDVLRRRLSRLPDQAVTLLGMAAVLGNEVEPQVLRAVAAVGIETVADQLDLGEAAGFLRKHPTRIGRYRFAHELIRAAIVETMPGLHAARLHARSIDAIVEIYGEDDFRVIHRLARHGVAAAEVLGPEQAALRLMRSALASRSLLNLDRAATLFEQALDLAVELPLSARRSGLQAELTMRAAQARFLLNGLTPSIKAEFGRAIDLSRSGSVDDQIMVLSGYGSHAVLWGDIAEAVAVGRELLAFGQPVDSIAAVNGRYLTGFGALLDPDHPADCRAIESSRTDGPVVKWSTRSASLALIEIVDGQHESGVARAVEITRRALADHSIDAWELAWTSAFAVAALVLADEHEAVLDLTGELPARSAGVAQVDQALQGGRAWALAVVGGPVRLGVLTQARKALRAQSDVLFRLVLTLAQARLVMGSDEASALLSEARQLIDKRGLRGFLPVWEGLDSRLTNH